MIETSLPLCYICGPADLNSGLEMGLTFQKRIPNGKLIWLDDRIGHWPMIESTGAFIDAYLNWLKEFNLPELYQKAN